MPRIEDRRATSEDASMFGDDPPFLTKDDAVGVGVDLDRGADGARIDRVLSISGCGNIAKAARKARKTARAPSFWRRTVMTAKPKSSSFPSRTARPTASTPRSNCRPPSRNTSASTRNARGSSPLRKQSVRLARPRSTPRRRSRRQLGRLRLPAAALLRRSAAAVSRARRRGAFTPRQADGIWS
jgi:hypothetical protein